MKGIKRMYEILVKLMIFAAFTQLGLNISDFNNPVKAKKAMVSVLNINWKPISVFPKEAQRFYADKVKK